jgi:hypothetical protein
VVDVEFRRAAAADLEEAADWYEAKQGGLGLEFLDVLLWIRSPKIRSFIESCIVILAAP